MVSNLTIFIKIHLENICSHGFELWNKVQRHSLCVVTTQGSGPTHHETFTRTVNGRCVIPLFLKCCSFPMYNVTLDFDAVVICHASFNHGTPFYHTTGWHYDAVMLFSPSKQRRHREVSLLQRYCAIFVSKGVMKYERWSNQAGSLVPFPLSCLHCRQNEWINLYLTATSLWKTITALRNAKWEKSYV